MAPGEVFGLVGESGCGKSTVALQLLGYRSPAMRTDGGEVASRATICLRSTAPELDALRGDRIAFVPQNPTTALNPGIRVGAQIDEILRAHGNGDPDKRRRAHAANSSAWSACRRRSSSCAAIRTSFRAASSSASASPWRLPAIPTFVVLDEPTTGLDVTTQEQIVALLIDLRARLGMSMLYVTHDLGLLSQIADRVGVMYAGRMVEIAPTAELFSDPKHPYTRGLIGSIPRIEDRSGAAGAAVARTAAAARAAVGLPFAPRCDWALPECFEERQDLEPVSTSREVACWRWPEISRPGRRTGGGGGRRRSSTPSGCLRSTMSA